MEPMSEEMKKDMQDSPEMEEAAQDREEEMEADVDGGGEAEEEAGPEEAEADSGSGETENAKGAGEGSWAERKAAKKKLKAEKKQDALREKIEELEDRVKRQMAEFENFRKRSEKEKTAMFETGAKSVIEKILPVVDNFERGLASIPEDDKGSAFAEGMEMIYKQLISELEKIEVKPIPALGEEFNPDFHNAVMQVESQDYGPGIIAQELQKGYTYRDIVVRHSMVAVTSES